MPTLTEMTRREFLVRASAGVSGVVLAGTVGACLPAPTPAAQPAVAVNAASGRTETPRSGGTLRYAQVGDFPTGLEGQTLSPAIDILSGVWDRLTYYDSNMQLQPMLAESWEISGDHTQIKLNLRRGVQFHTGRELIAGDVKWCLQRIKDPKVSATLASRAQVLIGVDAPEKYTVVLKAARPWPEAFDFLEYVNIIDPVTFQDVGVSRPTGTGPFAFSEYVQGDHLRLVRNVKYWRSDRPYLDEVVASINRDGQSAVLQLEAGTLDVVGLGLPVADAARLRSDSNFQVLFNTTTGASWNLVANCTLAPTNNKFVRQALNYALDRTRIAESTWHGFAKPEVLPWSATSPAYDAAKSNTIGFNLDKARSLLAESGALSIKLDLQWPTLADDFAVAAQIYQADLEKIGVTATLRRLEAAVNLETMLNKSYQGLALNLGSYGHLQPANLLQGTVYGPATNVSGFKEDTYTQLVNQLLTATDPAKQKSLYDEWNVYLVDQAWVLPVTQNPPHLAARANVRGLRYDAHEAIVLADVWLA